MDRPNDMQPAASSPRPKFTYQDYLDFPDDGQRHELIDGEHYVTPAPKRRHQQLSRRLLVALDLYLRDHPLGEVYGAPLDVILSDSDVVQPDILFVSNERSRILGEWVHGAPDLVVEILSASTRKLDDVAKRRLYERAGVKEYWIVDPEVELVKTYRRDDSGKFARVTELACEAADTLTTPLLPEFVLALNDLFA